MNTDSFITDPPSPQRFANESRESACNGIKKLFDLYGEVHDDLGECEQPSPKARELIRAQSVILHIASVLPAASLTDALYKLALWRWDCLDHPNLEQQRKNAVMHSAFRDIVSLAGEDDGLKGFDKTH